jgi:hypothetical protein
MIKVYQLLAHGQWFSPGTPASSTTKTGRHDIAEILLKVALKHQKSIKFIVRTNICSFSMWYNVRIIILAVIFDTFPYEGPSNNYS